MIKSIWTYIALVAVVGAVGGGAYLYSHQTTSMQVTETSLPAQPPPASAARTDSDEDVKRKTIEGIGSIKKLKPVPIAPVQR